MVTSDWNLEQWHISARASGNTHRDPILKAVLANTGIRNRKHAFSKTGHAGVLWFTGAKCVHNVSSTKLTEQNKAREIKPIRYRWQDHLWISPQNDLPTSKSAGNIRYCLVPIIRMVQLLLVRYKILQGCLWRQLNHKWIHSWYWLYNDLESRGNSLLVLIKIGKCSTLCI